MARFNPSKYDPSEDSSPGTEKIRQGPTAPKTLILDWTPPAADDRVCPCGCREVLHPSSRFRMGHDARLRGKLTRAHVTGTDVTIVKGRDVSTSSAITVADQFSSPLLDWKAALREAEGRYSGARAKTDASNAEILQRAKETKEAEANGNLKVGDRRLVKVGRWNYTGQVIAIYQLNGEAIFEYTSKGGDVKSTTVSLDEAGELPPVEEA